jgi:hypothetical protein
VKVANKHRNKGIEEGRGRTDFDPTVELLDVSIPRSRSALAVLVVLKRSEDVKGDADRLAEQGHLLLKLVLLFRLTGLIRDEDDSVAASERR